MKYPLENLLRPPVEWWSTLVCIAAGITVMMDKNTFLLMPLMSKTIALVLLVLGI